VLLFLWPGRTALQHLTIEHNLGYAVVMQLSEKLLSHGGRSLSGLATELLDCQLPVLGLAHDALNDGFTRIKLID
jgi:hypothetical protein